MKSTFLGGLLGGIGPMAASVGVALVVGFGVGRVSAPSRPTGSEDVEAKKLAQGVEESEEPKWQSVGGSDRPELISDLAGAAAIGSLKERARALDDILAKAGLEDVKKALAWANALPDGPMKKSALAKIMERWGQLDGPGAVAYATELYAETGNASLIREALKGWATKDPKSAFQQASQLGLAKGLQRDIRNDLLEQWASQNPNDAAGYALANRNPDNWGGIVGTVAERWAKQDPKAAVTWAASLTSGKDKKSAIYEAISSWADEDVSAAASYITAQPAGEGRDTMAGTLARHLGQENPEAGIKWAAMVGDPAAQERAVAGALIDLYRKDEVQARKILQTSSISAQVQQAALIRMTNRGPWWR
jgi:hypothetical protein